MGGFIAEPSDLSRQNNELMTSKDSDLTVIHDLDIQLNEYKRKYEQAKAEFLPVKGITILSFPLSFASYPHPNHSYVRPLPTETQLDNQLSVSADGAISDVHPTAFLTAIYSLLSADRSNMPARMLCQ
jgi:hypothetical protein